MSIVLPSPHPVRARWAPLNFHPFPGSNDSLTVAVIAIRGAEFFIAEAAGLERFHCFFENDADAQIKFVRLGIESLRRAAHESIDAVLNSGVAFGSSLAIGSFSEGSGQNLESIARIWLKKTSALATSLDVAMDVERYTKVVDLPVLKKQKILPAVREEMAAINPLLIGNFGATFRPKDRKIPIKIGYSGNKIVADFGKISGVQINPALDRVRSRLWLLSEHRDQTRHQQYREHEMLVVRGSEYAGVGSSREFDLISRASEDLMKEADKHEIRFRLLSSTKDVAQRIFQAEMAA